jgi:PII-like signaling protein
MTTLCVQFFVQEGMRHAGHPIHEWLFAEAKALGIAGGSAFRACAGFGRHGLHEDSFFELAGKLPENISFFADEARIQALVERVGAAGLKLVYVTYPVRVGVTGG